MIEKEQKFEIGRVIKTSENIAHVEMENSAACQSCSAKALCKPDGTGIRILKIKNTLNAQTGDYVQLDPMEFNQVKLIIMQYGLPLFGFLIGIISTHYLIQTNLWKIPKEIVQFITGFVLMGFMGMITFFWSKNKSKKGFSFFRMIKTEKTKIG